MKIILKFAIQQDIIHIQVILDKQSGMEQKIDSLIAKFSEFEARLSAIEISTRESEQVSHQPAETAVPNAHSQGQARVKTIKVSTTNSFVSPQNPNDICRQFDSLRDRLGKVSIPEK